MVSRVFPLEFLFDGLSLEGEFGEKFWIFPLEFFLGFYEPLKEELREKCFIYVLDHTFGQNLQSYWLFEIESKKSILGVIIVLVIFNLGTLRISFCIKLVLKQRDPSGWKASNPSILCLIYLDFSPSLLPFYLYFFLFKSLI